MGERTKSLATAGLVTELSAVLAASFGGAVWNVFSPIIWSKILLLFLVALWATTLLRFWVLAFSSLRQTIEGHSVAASTPAQELLALFAEETDV
jgi:hypothetical protein